jgi:hypothetical protein
MTDSQGKKENETRDSRTINIEIPANCFEGMFNMMTGKIRFGNPGLSCCEMPQDIYCPQPMDEEEQEIRIVIKKRNNNQ